MLDVDVAAGATTCVRTAPCFESVRSGGRNYQVLSDAEATVTNGVALRLQRLRLFARDRRGLGRQVTDNPVRSEWRAGPTPPSERQHGLLGEGVLVNAHLVNLVHLHAYVAADHLRREPLTVDEDESCGAARRVLEPCAIGRRPGRATRVISDEERSTLVAAVCVHDIGWSWEPRAPGRTPFTGED